MAIINEVDEASSSSPSTTRDHKYDVFISFRGADTRLNFTNHLYTALVYAHLTTFLDDEEISTGEFLKPELENAIKASRASIIVLSENFASSTWCLDELVLILEQKKMYNQIVIPVFYHVEPTHVRKQQSTFGEAMKKHNLNMESETNAEKKNRLADKMEIWKKALTEVSNLKGKDAKGRFEVELIDEIVNDLNNRLGEPTTLPLLIGMEHHIENITSWLKDGSSQNANVLIIWGMGGIGKTSLAKYVYELHRHDYTSSFVGDISRRCAEKYTGLLDVQKQLCDNLLIRTSSSDVHDVSAYTSKIQKALRHKKVFLVLDDIDSHDQLDALLGNKGFHSGSIIIITTKDASMIKRSASFDLEVQTRHKIEFLQGLSKSKSLELLCFHAFKSQKIKEGYEEVSKKLVNYCDSHPLALEVLGKSLLHKRDVAYWKECIKGLDKEPLPHVTKALQVSFESLQFDNDKELFKHIACFFVGMDRGLTETILGACNINTRSGIINLIDKCLLSIGWNNKLMMHQLVQEMGRNLVRQEKPGKPWKRSRLWCHEESFKALNHKKGSGNLIGLALDMRMLEKQQPMKTKALSEMDNLQLLQLNYVKINEPYKYNSKELRWLCMHGFCFNSIPSELPMENLVVLDMSHSKIESFDMSYSNSEEVMGTRKSSIRSDSEDIRLLGSLKILDLSFCVQLRSLGGFFELPKLEKLIILNCTSLTQVCESIEHCVELVFIDMTNCKMLRMLPRAIGKLKKTKTILSNGCDLLVFPPELRDMVSLQVLKADKNRINLQTILSNGYDLVFPPELRDMVSLQVLKADKNRINLQTILSNGCDLLVFPPELRDMVSLQNLKADKNRINSQTFSHDGVEVIPRDNMSFLSNLPMSLLHLSLSYNNLSNESFPMDFSCLAMLKELCLDGNPIVSMPICVRSLPRLERLSMNACTLLKTVSHPPPTLNRLSITSGPHSLSWINGNYVSQILFNPGMSPLDFKLHSELLGHSSFEIEGMVKIQSIADVEENVFRSLGWTYLRSIQNQQVKTSHLARGELESHVQMYFEFGIFSTFYWGMEIPSWISHRSKGSSISFTIPSSSNKLRGLNICSLHKFQLLNRNMIYSTPFVVVSNITKNLTWVYNHYIFNLYASEESGIYLSHWMFGKNEMEDGDQLTITIAKKNLNYYCMEASECGISLVYDDQDIEGEGVLGYYKSWNHIIGGDLSGFQLISGEYILRYWKFFIRPAKVDFEYCVPFVAPGVKYKEREVKFRALSQQKYGGHAPPNVLIGPQTPSGSSGE